MQLISNKTTLASFYGYEPIAVDGNKHELLFGVISSAEDWKELGRFRQENYRARKHYMMNELNEYGLDEFDPHSTTYAAWSGNKIIASIRLCHQSFEVNKFISHEELNKFLGKSYKNHYLEWSRLLISPKSTIPHLLHMIITYAGVKTIENHLHENYFGYSTPVIKRIFTRYQIDNACLEFKIPHRGNHPYILFKGNFRQDLYNFRLRHMK